LEVDKQALADRLAALSDAELQRRIESGTLTALAEEVARAELAARGLEGPVALGVGVHSMAEASPRMTSIWCVDPLRGPPSLLFFAAR
jgi:hypothetical protein